MYASVLMAVTDKFVVALVLSIVTTLLLIALVVFAFLAAKSAMKQNKADKLAEGEKAEKAREDFERQRQAEKAADEKASAEQLAALEKAREISRKIDEAKENLSHGIIEESESAPETARDELLDETVDEPDAPAEEELSSAEETSAEELDEAEEGQDEEAADESGSLETAATVAAQATETNEETELVGREEKQAIAAVSSPFGVRPERKVSPYSLSFKAKLIQGGEETQTFFGEIEDVFASFVDVRKTETWSKVRFKIKRDTLAVMSYRGSTLCIALAIDPSGRNLRGKCAKNMTGRRGFAATPLLIKLKSERALIAARDFIYELMASYDSERVYIDVRDYRLPYEDSESLVGRGLARSKPSAEERA